MRRRYGWLLVLLVPAVVVPVRACRGEAAPGQALGHDAAAALFESAWTVVRFGSPSAEPFEEQGLDIPLDRHGETWVEARKRVLVRLRLAEAAPRAAVLDLEPLPGTDRVRALLNDQPVGVVPLKPGRQRVRFDLPADRQQNGSNALGLVFGTEAPEGAPGGPPRHAARLFGLVVGPPSPRLDALSEAGAPPFSAWAEADGLVQAGPSTLRWASHWGGATLHLRGALRGRTGGTGARVRVTVEDAEGATEVWSAVTGDGGAVGEAWVKLPHARGGGLQQLSLAVEPLGPGPVWFVWQELQATEVPQRSPAAVDATALRAALANTNVVLVVFDAAGARHFGCYGHALPTTPAADRLAAEGVLFEHAYTPAVFTLSAMSSIWTSLLPDLHHRGAPHDERLPASVPTLAERLSAAGIRTAGFVANGMAGSGFGLDRGFAEFRYVGYEAGDLRPPLTPWLAAAARGGRFFLYVHVREPHTPLDAPPPFDTAFGGRKPISAQASDRWLTAVNDGQHKATAEEVALLEQLYDGNLAVADRELGWLRGQLEEAGLLERTSLILTGDHGEALHEHGFVGHNAQLYDESVHVPLILRLPARAGLRGRRVAEIVDHLDLAPTVADLFGLTGAMAGGVHGRSLLEVALGAPGRGYSLARTAGPRPRYALTDGATRFIFDSRYGEEELYDLRSDPGEQRDLAAAQPLRASVYRQRLHTLLLALPGRSTGRAAPRTLDAKQAEDLRALGYVN